MSCPGAAFHAHAPLAAETRPERTNRRSGAAWSLGWILSFVGHAGVAAVVLFAPSTERVEMLDASIMVELIGVEATDAAPGSGDVHTEPTDAIHQESHQAPQMSEPVSPAEPVVIKPEPPSIGENAHIETLPRTVAPPAFAMPPPKPTPPPRNVAVEFKVADAAQPSSNYPAATAPSRMESKSGTVSTETAALPSLNAGSAAKPFGDNRKPIYPAYAWRRGIEGRVVLNVTVTPDGRTKDVSVAQSSRNEALDEAAVVAVRKWRFHPARESGRAVASRLMVPVIFRLNEGR